MVDTWYVCVVHIPSRIYRLCVCVLYCVRGTMMCVVLCTVQVQVYNRVPFKSIVDTSDIHGSHSTTHCSKSLLFSCSCCCRVFLFVFFLKSFAFPLVSCSPMIHLAVTVAVICRVALTACIQWTSDCFECAACRTTGKGGCCFSFFFV